MKLGMQVGIGPGHIVLDGDPAPPSPKEQSPLQFSAHICCGQMDAWIKMPLGMEVGLGPGHIVLDGDPAPLKGAQPLDPRSRAGHELAPSNFQARLRYASVCKTCVTVICRPLRNAELF